MRNFFFFNYSTFESLLLFSTTIFHTTITTIFKSLHFNRYTLYLPYLYTRIFYSISTYFKVYLLMPKYISLYTYLYASISSYTQGYVFYQNIPSYTQIYLFMPNYTDLYPSIRNFLYPTIPIYIQVRVYLVNSTISSYIQIYFIHAPPCPALPHPKQINQLEKSLLRKRKWDKAKP